MKIAVTGATGFVGMALINQLGTIYRKKELFPILRGEGKAFSEYSPIIASDINATTEWSNKLQKIECVIHCAARVHVMNDIVDDPLEAFREVNLFGTLNLAKQAAEAGVKRFIFLSSIKVNGESTTDKEAFSAFDKSAAEDPYGISKSEAENQLLALGEETGMEIVIIRPPLVYGEGVKANFASLMKLVGKGLPLPFRSIKSNKRSLVSVYNLVDLIKVCIEHPKAANQIFLPSDDFDLSTADMVALMAKVQNKRNMSLPVPVWCFKLLGKVLNKSAVIDRLTGSLQLDISHTKNTLDWKPPYSVEHGFKLAVKMDEKND